MAERAPQQPEIFTEKDHLRAKEAALMIINNRFVQVFDAIEQVLTSEGVRNANDVKHLKIRLAPLVYKKIDSLPDEIGEREEMWEEVKKEAVELEESDRLRSTNEDILPSDGETPKD